MPDDLVRDARELYDAAELIEQDNHTEALEDLRFRAGEQWDSILEQNRRARGVPVLKINRIPQFVNQVTGDVRLNPPSAKVRPAGGGASTKMAETLTGAVRNIEVQSRAQQVYIHAVENAATCGQGFFRITTQYSTDDGWEQDIRIQRIKSPLAVLFDPGATDQLRTDAQYCFVRDWMPKSEFKKRFPKASTTGWEDNNAKGEWRSWLTSDDVLVCEYWRKVPVKRKLILCANFSTFDITDMEDDEIVRLIQKKGGGGYINERMVDTHKVEMRLLNGVEELEKKTEWVGRDIPIIPVLGHEVQVGDRVVRHGLVRFLRDPQRLFNVHRSALAEIVASSPKAKWLGPAGMFAGYENYYQNANQANHAFLPFNPDPQFPQGPQRIQPEAPNQQLLAEISMTTQDMEATTGIYRDMMGKESNAQSGRAIIARQREGDTGTFIYKDNLAEAVCQAASIIVDILPKIYDTPRTIRTLGEDGSEDFVEVNFQDPVTGQIVNDLSVGKYDVVVDVGPSYRSRREEARDSMLAFFQASPDASKIAADLFAEAMDWPEAEKIAARYRKQLVAQGIAEPKEGDPPPPPPGPPGADQLLAQAEMLKGQASLMKAQADMKEAEMRLQLDAASGSAEEQRLRMEMMADWRIKQAEIQAEMRSQAVELATKMEMQRRELTADREKELLQVMLELRTAQAQQQAGPTVAMNIPEAASAEWGKGMDQLVQHIAALSAMTQELVVRQHEGHGMMMRALTAPKRVIRDETGRPVGVESVMEG